MNRRPLSQMAIPAAGISYVIVGLLAHSGVVWTAGALAVGLVAVVSTGWSRRR